MASLVIVLQMSRFIFFVLYYLLAFFPFFFWQNRQSYSQMSGDVKSSTAKEAGRLTGKGRGKVEAKLASKDADMETSTVKESVSGVQEKLKAFCTRFVRLNGILFTRTRY